VTGRARFGDFLHLAHQHLGAGGPNRDGRRENLEEVVAALSRLVAVMSGHAHDLTVTFPTESPRAQPVLSPPARAFLEVREALANAAGFLAARDRPHWRAPAMTSPLAHRLDAAATALRMGRDLLQTHFAPGASGGRRQRSEWAAVIESDAVSQALLADIAALAHKAACQCADLTAQQPGRQVGEWQMRRRLIAACQWLWVPATAVHAAGHGQADRGGALLLAAVPVNALPARHAIQGGKPIGALCDGAVSSAERVRYLAWRAAAGVPVQRDVTTASLRRVAETSTVTSHNCAGLLHTLATHMAKAGFGRVSDRLAAAAQAAGQARDTWLSAAREAARLRTVTPGGLSPAAAEAGELAVWTGRLAYADSQWTPADGPDRALRPPETLAGTDVPLVVAVAHQASETLASLARADHEQIRAAARQGCLLVPTRSLPEDYDIPYPFAHVPQARVTSLLGRYADAARASRHTADAIGEAAEMVRAPSRTLALARAAVANHAGHVPEPVPGQRGGADAEAEADAEAREVPGPVERILRDLGVTDETALIRSAGLDRDAERLIVYAATSTQTRRRPSPNGFAHSASTAALVSHALRSGNPNAVALLSPPGKPEREPPEPEP
jgi:hypothetical protein